MIKLTCIALLFGLTACSEEKRPEVSLEGDFVFEEKIQPANVTVEEKTKNALLFLNTYILTDFKSKEEIEAFVFASELVTQNFRKEYELTLEAAEKHDPEMGFGMDEILDAQDCPDKGFEIESFDEKTNILVVKGIDWPEFNLTARVAEENGEWLLDGSGIVNVPEKLRSKR